MPMFLDSRSPAWEHAEAGGLASHGWLVAKGGRDNNSHAEISPWNQKIQIQYAMLCYTISYHTRKHSIISYHVISYHIVLCINILHSVMHGWLRRALTPHCLELTGPTPFWLTDSGTIRTDLAGQRRTCIHLGPGTPTSTGGWNPNVIMRSLG
jgi:hypothetical protein